MAAATTTCARRIVVAPVRGRIIRGCVRGQPLVAHRLPHLLRCPSAPQCCQMCLMHVASAALSAGSNWLARAEYRRQVHVRPHCHGMCGTTCFRATSSSARRYEGAQTPSDAFLTKTAYNLYDDAPALVTLLATCAQLRSRKWQGSRARGFPTKNRDGVDGACTGPKLLHIGEVVVSAFS